jgi:apolipoprotein N-acyltransferase
VPAVRPRGAGRAFLLGLLTGLVCFAGTVYWTSGVMARYGGLSTPLSIAVAGLLVAYLALFPALFALALHLLLARGGVAWLWLAPVVWTASEYGRLRLFGGFPWVLLGYSQVEVLPIAQLASVSGVFGLSMLVVLVSTALVWPLVGRGWTRWGAPAFVAGVVAVVGLWGAARLADGGLTRAGRPLLVGLVQGNVPQDQKWDPARADAIFARYLRLTREVAGRGAELVLWPESSTPFSFGRSPETAAIRALAREHQVAILVGSDDWESADGATRIYNAAFLVGADGETKGVYRKVHLVPFGEYVPLRSLLFFARPLVQAVSDFSPGAGVNTLAMGETPLSTAICYEVVYPGLIREGVLNGSQLLTTITNDAWFGRSSAPWQHFAMASLRAIEQGRYLVRSANTGISGAVDPYGRVLVASDLFVAGAWVVPVRLLDATTVYARIGDVAGWGSTVLAALALLAMARRRAAPRADMLRSRPGRDAAAGVTGRSGRSGA